MGDSVSGILEGVMMIPNLIMKGIAKITSFVMDGIANLLSAVAGLPAIANALREISDMVERLGENGFKDPGILFDAIKLFFNGVTSLLSASFKIFKGSVVWILNKFHEIMNAGRSLRLRARGFPGASV